MKLTVPETLKGLLVDDWEAVTKNNQVRVCTEFTLCEVGLKLNRVVVGHLASYTQCDPIAGGIPSLRSRSTKRHTVSCLPLPLNPIY